MGFGYQNFFARSSLTFNNMRLILKRILRHCGAGSDILSAVHYFIIIGKKSDLLQTELPLYFICPQTRTAELHSSCVVFVLLQVFEVNRHTYV